MCPGPDLTFVQSLHLLIYLNVLLTGLTSNECFNPICWNDFKIKSTIKSLVEIEIVLQGIHTLRQCVSEPTFTYIFMSSVLVRLFLHGTHTAALVSHLHLPTLTTASCVLPWTFISIHLALPVSQEMAGQLTRIHRTPAAPNALLSMETCTCFDSSQLFVPSLMWVQHWPMWRPLALIRQATQFPPISSLFFPCGQPCQQHLVAWEGPGTSEVVGFGAEAWISSLSWLPPTPPHSSFSLRSVSVNTQSSLYSANMVTAVTAPSRDTTLARLPTKASEAWLPRR